MNETIQSQNDHIVCLIKYRLKHTSQQCPVIVYLIKYRLKHTSQQCPVNGLVNDVHLTIFFTVYLD